MRSKRTTNPGDGLKSLTEVKEINLLQKDTSR